MADKLRGGVSRHLRLAASEIMMRDHLPGILQALRQHFPKLKVTLREGYDPEVVAWLQEREVDVSIGLLGSTKPPTGLQVIPLFKLPLVLLVQKATKLKSAAELWSRDRIEDSLITVPSNQPICRAFQEGLARLKVDWFGGIEVSTVELVQTYVANGYGIGVTVGVPKMKYHPQVRVLPLEGFDDIPFGILWQGRRDVMLDTFFKICEAAARRLLEGEDPKMSLLK